MPYCKKYLLTAHLLTIFLAVIFVPLAIHAKTNLVVKEAGFEKIKADPVKNITEYRLKSNGLTILLAPRNATPVVTAMVVYHVGSRNEAVGYTGATHFLEHMMFKGTPKHDPLKGTGIDDILKPVGGFNNATTSYDRTKYFEVVPSADLPCCLELEADRMRNALLRNADRSSEMTVVRNELERIEDDARSLLETNLFAVGFREHPYHHPVIGWRSDVEGVPLERLRQFYNDFYWPNNATLLIIGDFQTKEALSLIAHYFSKIPASPKPIPRVYTTEPAQEGERRFVVQRGADLPKVMLGFHGANALNADTYALEVIAVLLGDDRRPASRLYKDLVDTGLASSCYAYNYSLRDPGLFTVFASATPGTPLEVLEKTMISELNSLAFAEISDAELERAKQSLWKRIRLYAADPVGLAEQLAEAVSAADWSWWSNLEENIKAVTKQDVQRVAGKYFTYSNRSVGFYLPKQAANKEKQDTAGGLLNIVEAPVAMPATKCSKAAAVIPQGTISTSSKKSFARKSINEQVKRKIFPNGLTVLVMPIASAQIVSVSGRMRAGTCLRSPEATLVPQLVAAMLTKGSKRWSKNDLACELENLGTTLEFEANNFFVDFNSEIVVEDLSTFMPLLSDVLQNPRFLRQEFQKSKKIVESSINEAKDNTGQVATNALLRALYEPRCVYFQKAFSKQLEELNTIDITQLKAFHKANFSPANTVLAIVGDVEPDKVFQLVEQCFSTWSGPKALLPTTYLELNTKTCCKAVVGERIYNPIGDKANVDIVIGLPAAVSIRSKDFYAFLIANAALGHDTISSRLAVIREKYGLTYGISSNLMDSTAKHSPWLVEFSVNPNNAERALTLAKNIVNQYCQEGITQKELLQEAKRLAGEYLVQRLRTPKQIADGLSKYEILGLSPQFMDSFANNLNAVTLRDVNDAISQYCNLKQAVISIAGTLPNHKSPVSPNKK